MAENKRSLATKLRRIRIVAGMTPTQTDANFGDRGIYQKMESGKMSISHASRRKLAELFDVHPSMLRTTGGD